MRRSLFLVLGCIVASAAPLSGQFRTELLARVDAVVGDSVITNLDLEDAILAWQATTQQSPPTDSVELLRLKHELLEARIDQLLLLQAAASDTTLRVPEEAITNAVNARISQIEREYGGRAALERALESSNLTLETYRERLMLQQRRDALIQNYVRRIRQERKPPTVTEEDIRAFFEANREQIGMRPPTIAFRQVVLPVEPSDSALARTRALADSLIELARGGEDFAALARRYSEDPGSRDLGGDLGFSRPGGNYYLPFERAMFSPTARPGDVIGPVRTPVGLHIIKLERIRGAERQVRHILLRPEINEADIERAVAKGDSLAEAMRAGADVDSIAALHADPDELVRVGPWRQDSLPALYAEALSDVSEGEVVGPIRLTDGPAPQVVVLRVTDLEPARPASVDDYRATIQERLADNKLMEELIDELRASTYIEIRLPDPGGGNTG